MKRMFGFDAVDGGDLATWFGEASWPRSSSGLRRSISDD
jgi:hypothetical protein